MEKAHTGARYDTIHRHARLGACGLERVAVGITKQLRGIGCHINLLYLDSYDVDYNYWYPSAAHHLKELTAAWRAIDTSTLVVVDDCPMSANLVAGADGQFQLDRFYKPIVGGKGRLVAEFAEEVEAKMVFSHYQHAWNGFQG